MSFKTRYEKVFGILVRDNAGKNYDCLWDLPFHFEEVLTSFKFLNSN